MRNEKSQSKKDIGLPEIAQNNKRKRPVIFVLIGVVVVVFSMYFFMKSNKKLSKPLEETYTIQTDVKKENKDSSPMIDNKASVNNIPDSATNRELLQQQIALMQQKQKELEQRLNAPLMLVNNTSSTGPIINNQASLPVSKDSNTQFMNQASAQISEKAMATKIGPLNSIIAEGSLIHATLESATNSDLPGFLRASVSEPVYSEDGAQILVPRGSRLIGQYKSGMTQGQSRIFVVWTRLITPNGVSIQLGSAGADSLGIAGMGADEIDRHFWERFGTASLLSLIGAGAANVGVNNDTQDNSASSYRSVVANNFAQTADESLQQKSGIAPTLKTYQGKPIIVFVAHDLHFQNSIQQTKSNIHIF